jgi:ABC-type dipeptide/oligopeptide/nickel transport system permease subunit
MAITQGRATHLPFAGFELDDDVRGIPERLRSYIRNQTVGACSLLVLLGLIVVAVAAPWISPYDPDQQFLDRRYAPPLSEFFLGGDEFGRDVLSRIIYGARISLYVGFMSTLVGSGIGFVLGAVTGYFGGTIDLIGQRLIDTIQAFPGLILAMVLILALGPSLNAVVIAVAVPTIPVASRVTRSVTMQIRELDYVTAARSIGAEPVHLIRRHVLPQLIAPLLIVWSSRVGAAIVTEATLSFIGLGVAPPTATWGQMLSQATKAFYMAPWLSIYPGIALRITVFAVNLLGDSLRDTLDPRLYRRR